jgi:two-component system, OmpR family, sensor histidine kinase ArlS
MDSDINGNMTKKLLDKTLQFYLIFSVITLCITAPLFYLAIEHLYLEEVDETLLLHKKEFTTEVLPTFSISDTQNWNTFNRDVHIQPNLNVTQDSLFNTLFYDKLDNENEPYRQLAAPITIEGKKFLYLEKANLIETKDLIQSIASLFLLIISVLLIGLYFMTKKLSQKLWTPFNETLWQIEQFEIDKNKDTQFNPTTIEEFSRLNESLKTLIHKNRQIYQNQREFIENAAHELQTPLGVFQAKIDTLSQLPVTYEQAEILSSLNDNISRLNRLNKNLLLLSKIEHEGYSEKQRFSVQELIVKHQAFYAEQASARNITIRYTLTDDLELEANPTLVEIILRNLLLNAIRHNKSNGSIEVILTQSSLTIRNTSDTKAIDASKIFNRFSKTNPSQQGTGLGLAIVKKIADLNNWSITYDFAEDFHRFQVHF